MAISILLAESHPRLRRGIRRLVESKCDFHVISEVSGASEAVRAAEQCVPDIVVTEIPLHEGTGIEVARQIRTRRSEVGIVFLSMYSEVSYVVSSIEAGVRGYVLKDTAEEDLCDAIYAVSRGSSFHTPVVRWLLAQDCVERLRCARDVLTLSEQEGEVIQLLAKGRSCQEVEMILNLKAGAAEAHRFSALCKIYVPDLRLRNR